MWPSAAHCHDGPQQHLGTLSFLNRLGIDMLERSLIWSLMPEARALRSLDPDNFLGSSAPPESGVR
eukprot:42976-Eustigmatos_ZCMA.PRE.1